MDLNEQLNQLEADLTELGSLSEKAERKRVKDLLTLEMKKVEKELSAKRQQKEQLARKEADPASASKAAAAAYTVKITNYAWDQSDKFVKIYLTLKDVQNIPAENVEVTFTERSFSVLVKDLNGKNHQMNMLNLLDPINEKDSYKKIKTDMLLIMCKKRSTEKWECLTKVAKQSKDKDKPKMDDNADPSDGLMNMLKKIYDEGDDEMKRTINKAWSESQEKKMKAGDMADF